MQPVWADGTVSSFYIRCVHQLRKPDKRYTDGANIGKTNPHRVVIESNAVSRHSQAARGFTARSMLAPDSISATRSSYVFCKFIQNSAVVPL